MATKRSGKVAIQLRGGPYGGYKCPLSVGYRPEDIRTLKFFAKGYLGQYDASGTWHGIRIGFEYETNDNIVLGWTD